MSRTYCQRQIEMVARGRERGADAASRRSGFTLVEMLVVVGIIAVVVGLIIPATMSARKAAKVTQCQSKLVTLSAALTAFQNDHSQDMPDASSTNSEDSPYSARGLWLHGLKDYHPGDGIPKPFHADDPKLGKGRRCLPCIGQLLDPYLRGNNDVWRCPTQKDNGTPGGLRTGKFVHVGTAPAMWDDLGEWRPNYLYLCTKEYYWFLSGNPGAVEQYHMRDWMVRNVGGLNVNMIRPVDRKVSSDIVVMMDYLTTYHSPEVDGVYDTAARGHYKSNFLFLDGHVEAREFASIGTLLNQVHRGIRQKAWGEDFHVSFDKEFNRVFEQ